MKKRGLLVVLVLIFLAACTFIQKEDSSTATDNNDVKLMNQLDTIVKRAAKFAKVSESDEVQEVFQNKEDQIWKLHFSNGTIILYDEKTDEFIHAE